MVLKLQKTNKLIDLLTSEEAFCLYIVTCMIAIPLGEFITDLMGKAFVSQPTIFTIFSIIGVFLVTLKISLRPDKRHWSDFFFFSSMIFMFLSLVYSKDIARAVRYDINGTNEFPQYFLGYYCLMFAGFQLSKNKLRKIVLYVFIGLSFLEGILGVFQSFGMRLVEQMHGKDHYGNDIFGLTQNANYFGGLVVLFLGACLGAALFTKNNKRRVVYIILTVLSVYCSYATLSRSSLLGVGVMILSYLVMFGVMHRKYKDNKMYKICFRVLFFGLIGVIGFGVLYVLISQSAMNRVIKTFNEFKGLFSGDINHFGAGRGYIWTYCIESIPKNWVWGVGLDNLYYCYTSSSHWMEAMYYSNRAHNVYLHVLTTQGVFGFANYMALLITSCVMAVRRILKTEDEEDRKITWTYFGMIIGYLAVSLLISRVFNVELYFYAALGAMVPRMHEKVAK